jgi:septum formation inhibitor-activating ATPase MinD
MPVAEIDSEADVTRAFDQLASDLAGVTAPVMEETKQGKGLLDKIFRRG